MDNKKTTKPKAEKNKRKSMSPDAVMWIRLIFFMIFTLLGIVCLISVFEFFFHWESIIEPVDPSVGGARLKQGGSFGQSLAVLLVSEGFGVASVGIIAFIGLLAYICLCRKKNFSSIKLVALILTATFLVSVTFGLFDMSARIFGCGLGGGLGHLCAGYLKQFIGFVPSAVLLVFLMIVWASFASSGFFHWITNTDANRTSLFGRLRKKKEEEGTEENNEPQEEEPEDEEPEKEEESEPQEETGPQTPEEETPESEEDPLQEELGVNVTTIEGTLDTTVTEELPWIDPRAELSKYKFPELTLLKSYKDKIFKLPEAEKNNNIRRIIDAYANFKIEITAVTAIVGPTVTLYQLQLGKGVSVNSIMNRSQDIAVALGIDGVRVILNDGVVGIEVPNKIRSVVPLRATLNSDEFRESKAQLPIAIGYTITQKTKVFDLCDAPHLLVAGATQQGKSVGLNVIIASLLYAKHPSELKFVFIDPKRVEFSAYRSLYKHYLAVLPGTSDEKKERDNSIAIQPEAAYKVLQSLCKEMEKRFDLLEKAGVPKISEYNKKYQEHKLDVREGHKFLPYIVTVIDEYADLTMSGNSTPEGRKAAKGISDSIIRLAQKGRAAGIHVILATQSPRVQVVTGLIKTNFPTRIAFRVSQSIDSMTILGMTGAEKLVGKGDMLYYAGMLCERIQCALIDTDEIGLLTTHVERQNRYQECYAHPYYLPEVEDEASVSTGGDGALTGGVDALFKDAANTVFTCNQASVTVLQRKLGIGYARAAKIMDQLEAAGIVGAPDGSKPRAILVSSSAELDTIVNTYVS